MRALTLAGAVLALAGAAGSRSFAPPARTHQPDSLLVRAESLLLAGNLPAARRVAELLERDRRNDARVLTVLARVHLAWPVIGRFTAESLLTRAIRLDPTSPEPHYWLGHVGLALMGDDGEGLARRGVVRALALNPHYRDAWAIWLRLYRGDRERRDMLAVLAPHAGDPVVDLRRAQLLVELRRYGDAEPLLRRLAASARWQVEPRVLLARVLFELGQDSAGTIAYESGVALADRDTGGVLWNQIRSIAAPGERIAWEQTPPEAREAFFRLFWARREPDVRTRANERLGEHFRRMAQAQRVFAILHPNSRFHHSAIYRRRMGLGFSVPPDRELDRVMARARAEPCAAELPSVRDARFVAGHAPIPDTSHGQLTVNLEDGLDDRGRIWVRHGPPDVRAVHGLDGETWCYLRPEGTFRVTFLRLGGDMVVRPVREGEAESARHLLATDRPDDAGADLEFRFWPATFRAARDGSLTELLLFPDSLDAVAVLVDAAGREIDRDSGVGRRLALVAPPGRYALLLDGARGRRRGGWRGTMTLPDYAPGRLAVSSLLLAAGATAAQRDALEAAAPAGLRLRVTEPMRLYAEVYGLGSRDSTVAYEARYVFESLGGGFLGLGRRERTTTVAFDRAQPLAPRIVESLVVDPGRLPAGHYRLRLEITDRVRETRVVSAVLEFDLR